MGFGKRRFQTLVDLLKFRALLAHGKTTTLDICYDYRGNTNHDFVSLDPEWLRKFWSDEAVERAFANAREIIKFIHGKAGFPNESTHLMALGSFAEESEDE